MIYSWNTLNISNPAMSRTPMKTAFFIVGSTKVLLQTSTKNLKTLSYNPLAIPATEFVVWSIFWPLVTHSVPTFFIEIFSPILKFYLVVELQMKENMGKRITLIFGLQKAFIICSRSTPRRVATFLPAVFSLSSGSHCSSLPFCLNFYNFRISM